VTGTDLVLEWGVRASFLAYIEGLPDGVIDVAGDAERADGVFRFPGRGTGQHEYAFDGRLHFFAHQGVLDVTLDRIRVEGHGAGGMLTAETAGMRLGIAALANIESGGDVPFRSDRVTLTDDGAALLGGVYSPGAPAAPLIIRSVR
jgi:hypothetical protein